MCCGYFEKGRWIDTGKFYKVRKYIDHLYLEGQFKSDDEIVTDFIKNGCEIQLSPDYESSGILLIKCIEESTYDERVFITKEEILMDIT